MKILLFGDIHGRWPKVNRIIDHELSEGGVAISAGDLCNYKFEPLKNQTLYFTPGNHENFYCLSKLKETSQSKMVPIFAGDTVALNNGLKIAGLPGVYSPNFFEGEESHPKYWRKEGVESLLELKEIDIFVSHEAPSDMGIEKKGKHLGSPLIKNLITKLRPRIAISGHHDTCFNHDLNGTRVLGLQQPNRSYLVLNTDDFSITRKTAEMKTMAIGYQYPWEKKL